MATDSHRRYMRSRYARRKEQAMAILGGACACGAKEDLVFKSVTGAKFGVIYSLSEDKFVDAVRDNFTLSCRGCLYTRTITHGAYHAYYRHGCRCDECEEWHADYVLMRREDRRRE